MMGNNADAPRCKPAGLKRMIHASNTWQHVVPVGINVFQPLTVSYWENELGRFHAGDEITVLAPDYSLSYGLLICEVISVANYLRILARPFYPHNLELPPVTQDGVRPRYGAFPT